MREFQSTNETEFLLSALKEKIRLDTRGLLDARDLQVEFVSKGALVQMGDTKILASVSATITEPYPDRPSEGIFIINTDVTEMGIPTIDIGKVSEEEVSITRHLEKSIRFCRAIDTESLCIVAGESVWTIRLDVHVLDHNGNLLDCSLVASVCALMAVKMNAVTVKVEEVTIHSFADKNPEFLHFIHIPVSVSFALFHDGSILVVDPILAEENTMEGSITLTINSHKELCSVFKRGGSSIDQEMVLRCFELAKQRADFLIEFIKAQVESSRSLLE